LRIKIFSLAFLFLLVVPISTVFLVLKSQQKQVRREVKWKMIAGIDKSELEFLMFSKHDAENMLQWKHKREFQFQGEFYDVVEKETRGDSVVFWCWWDHEETKLNRKLDNLLASHFNHDPTHKNKKDSLQKLFKTLYFEHQLRHNFPEFNLKNTNEHWFYQVEWKETCLSCHLPPPKLV